MDERLLLPALADSPDGLNDGASTREEHSRSLL